MALAKHLQDLQRLCMEYQAKQEAKPTKDGEKRKLVNSHFSGTLHALGHGYCPTCKSLYEVTQEVSEAGKLTYKGVCDTEGCTPAKVVTFSLPPEGSDSAAIEAHWKQIVADGSRYTTALKDAMQSTGFEIVKTTKTTTTRNVVPLEDAE